MQFWYETKFHKFYDTNFINASQGVNYIAEESIATLCKLCVCFIFLSLNICHEVRGEHGHVPAPLPTVQYFFGFMFSAAPLHLHSASITEEL